MKDFNEISAGRIAGSIATATSKRQQQGTATPEEQKARADKLQTQGRKGCKAVRINTAFTPTNHRYIKIMSRITGQSMTQFINFVIEQYRNEHPEIYEEAEAIYNKLAAPSVTPEDEKDVS